MIGFLLKKTFFDIWDNLFKVALVNLGFIACMAVAVFLPPLFEGLPALGLGILGIGVLGCFVYLAAAASVLGQISDYKSFGFGDFFRSFKKTWPIGLAAALLVLLVGVLIQGVIPFYLQMGSLVGLLLGAVVFWTLVIGVLSLQFFFAVRFRLGDKPLKALKKCFLIFFDNPGFCLFSFLHNLVILVLSALLAFLFPGPAGVLLFWDEALRLRLLKYDYLEENPGANRKKIPWDSLLIDERERTGTRTLKSFIFPWKD
jgi:hypothetical protein